MFAGTFAYVAIRWRKAPAAFKAMNYVAIASLVAGVVIGASVMRALFGPTSLREHRASEPGEGGDDASGASGTSAGVPASDVASELYFYAIKHLRGSESERAKRIDWLSVAEDCRLGLADSHSLRCKAASIGAEFPYSESSGSIPYDEVMQFCGADFLDKASKVCIAAYRFGGRTGSK